MSMRGVMKRRNKQDPAYPWAGDPRRFMAVAMPNGDARYGIEEQLVMLTEKRRHCADKVRVLSREETEALVAELQGALRAFDLAKEFARDVADMPRAASGSYPVRDHRTVAQIEEGV